MVIEYEVIPFGPEIELAYARLFPDQAERKSAEMLRWRFQANPHGTGHFAIAREDGRIVGMIALVATRLLFNERRYRAIQAIDTIVAQEARGKFLFVRMGQAIYEHANEMQALLLWGFPNALAARGWFGRLGWKRLGIAPFVARPMRTGYFLRRTAPFLSWIDLPLGGWTKSRTSHFRIVDHFGDESRELCDRFNAETACALDYSPEFLNWRLIDCPHSSYRTVADFAPDGRMRAMVSSVILEKHGARILYLMEAMSARSESRHLRKLLNHEIAHAIRAGAELGIGWNMAGSPNTPALRRAGFFPLPERFWPVEIHFGARPLSDQIPAALMSRQEWYLSYLNSDTV
jgi:hypothetical protein